MKIYVSAQARIEGIHSWPDAPKHRSFLRNSHRHEFHIKVFKAVSHGDREVEIIDLKHDVIRCLRVFLQDGEIHQFGTMSCEDIASHLMNHLDLSVCQVLEDGENGAFITI